MKNEENLWVNDECFMLNKQSNVKPILEFSSSKKSRNWHNDKSGPHFTQPASGSSSIYFSDKECSLDSVSDHQASTLKRIVNDQGSLQSLSPNSQVFKDRFQIQEALELINHGLETKDQWTRVEKLLDKSYGQDESRLAQVSQHQLHLK